MADHTFKELTHQRVFMRMWFARLFGTTGNQMVAVGCVVTLLVVAHRDRMVG